jgi:acetolactate synthase I/II/III large subunit
VAQPDEDILHALETLLDTTGAAKEALVTAPAGGNELGTGPISANAIARSLAALSPEDAIVVDESVSTGGPILAAMAGARPHDLLKNVGGSIGFAMPAAVGTAVACPDRKTLCLQADGSAMYTLQALWTQVREKLNVTNVIFANRSYAILHRELANVQAGNPGPRALSMLDIGNPDLDWCALARGMGMEATRVTDMDEFNRALAAELKERRPGLIEVVM